MPARVLTRNMKVSLVWICKGIDTILYIYIRLCKIDLTMLLIRAPSAQLYLVISFVFMQGRPHSVLRKDVNSLKDRVEFLEVSTV